jgi:ERCC4-type nuclease
MPIRYILDNRERELQAIFKKNYADFDSRQLDLGDIIILYSKGEIQEKKEELSKSALRLLKQDSSVSSASAVDSTAPEPEASSSGNEMETYTIVIERKTFTDLKASIADGRYHEQKARYMKLPKGTCYYLLENNDPDFAQLGKKQYLGAYIHTIIRDKLPVFVTSSPAETFEFLTKIGQALEEFGFNYDETTESVSKASKSSYETSQIKKKKAEGREVYKQQLCCFPGISSKKADTILAAYPDMSSLMHAVKTNTFKVKGIGKVLFDKIKESLIFDQEASTVSNNSKIVFE